MEIYKNQLSLSFNKDHMKKIILITCLLFLFFFSKKTIAQSYPVGFSVDSFSIFKDYPYVDVSKTMGFGVTKSTFTIYKPANYDSLTSPILLAFHGSGGHGSTTAAILQNIADRRNAMIIAPDMPSLGCVRLDGLMPLWDSVGNISTEIIPALYNVKSLYKYLLQRESRNSMPTYMIGFSAGAQFVTRYLMYRTAYPDSIPLKMAVSADPQVYTWPTRIFSGDTMRWMKGFYMGSDWGYSVAPCVDPPFTDSLFCFFNNDNVIQYYNENYGVLIGTADIALLPYMSQIGANRYERAQRFYAFCDSNAINRGTTLKWSYAEVPNIGHSELYLYTTKATSTDTSTIAEQLLFDTPYHAPLNIAPVAEFYTSSYKIADTINVGDTIFFINASYNSNSYLWYFGDSTTSTAVNPYHVYNSPGSFEVALSARNANGCHGWRNKRHLVKVLGTVGVKEEQLTNINVQLIPNPAHNNCELKIVGDGLQAIKTGELFSAQGVKILTLFNSLSLSGTYYNQTINIKDLRAGSYYIKISGDNGFVTKKLVVY